MRVAVNTDRCCASGMCALTDPMVFDQSEDDGTVVLLQPEPPAEHHSAVRTAAMLCPSGAISVTAE